MTSLSSHRSPVFKAMLQSDMVEKVDGVIKIEDASKIDVKQVSQCYDMLNISKVLRPLRW